MATAALAGSSAPRPAGEVRQPLALHVRGFLDSLPQLGTPQNVATALKALLGRPATVSRLRRAALVSGCIVLPLIACLAGFLVRNIMQNLTQANPGVMELQSLLQMRTSGRFWAGKHVTLPSDREFALYIAGHYRNLITNSVHWSDPYVMVMIKGADRQFAEQSVAEHPTLTPAETAEADTAVGKYVPKQNVFGHELAPGMPAMVFAISLFAYVGLPAVLAALLFRGGLVLLVGGVTYVRRDGVRASRLRLLWRALVTWLPVFILAGCTISAFAKHVTWATWCYLAALALLAAISVALPQRGLQDRLAGTWPVPR